EPAFGVMETLAKISTMVLSHLREQMTKKGPGTGNAPGIKRTYSKEGVSDEAVVKNLLEDIATAGGVEEAKKAGDIPGGGNGAPARPAPSMSGRPAPPRVPSNPGTAPT